MFVIRHKFRPIFESNIYNDSRWLKHDGTFVDMDLVLSTLDAALQDLALNYPSVEYVLKHKDIIFTDHPQIRTMATDGVSIFINPEFAENLLNKDENEGALYFEFVLIHEALHILFNHCYKDYTQYDKFSDRHKVNMAQDYEINYIIENFLREGVNTTAFKGVTEKIEGCYNEEYGKKGLTWEEIYYRIPKIERKDDKKIPTSDEFKRGFEDGYNEILDDLKKRKLVL